MAQLRISSGLARVEQGRLVIGNDLNVYRDLVLQSAPLALWILDEKSGSSAADSSVNSTTGTYTGPSIRLNNPSIVTSQGSAAYLNNPTPNGLVNTYIAWLTAVAGGHPFTSVGNANAYSIEFWVQSSVQNTGQGGGSYRPDMTVLELREAGASPNVPFSVGINDGYLAVGRSNGTSEQIITDSATTLVSDNTIHHCVVTVNVNSIEFYVDGVNVSSASFTTATGDTSVAANSCYMTTGARAKDAGARESHGFMGLLSCIAVYGTELSAPTILAHYNAGVGLADVVTRTNYNTIVAADSPASWWRFNEFNDSLTFADSGSNAQGGTFENIGDLPPTGGNHDIGQPPLIMDVTAGINRDVGGTTEARVLNSVAGGHAFTAFGDASYTLEGWVYMRAAPVASPGFWSPGNLLMELRQETSGAGTKCAFSFGVEDTFRLSLGITDDYVANAERALSTASVLSLFTFHHVVVTVEVSGSAPTYTRTATFYVDGVASGSHTFVTPTDTVAVGSTTCNLQIGWRSTDAGALANAWSGFIDEVAIYNGLLSPTRILAHYNAGVS